MAIEIFFTYFGFQFKDAQSKSTRIACYRRNCFPYFQSTDSHGSESSQSFSPEMGGRRRKQSGKGRRQLRSSDSEESDVIDMNSKSKKSDETNREEPNKGADGESRIFSCVIVIFLTPQDVNVVSVQRK